MQHVMRCGTVAQPSLHKRTFMQLIYNDDSMPVQFLTSKQRGNYDRYVGDPSADELTRYFCLDDADHEVTGVKRGDHNRLGFALQHTTARFLGTFLEDPADVPSSVLQTLVRQLRVTNLDHLPRYCRADQRWEHTAGIRSRCGFCDFNDSAAGFRLSRWLYPCTGPVPSSRASCLIVQRLGCWRTRYFCRAARPSNVSLLACANELKIDYGNCSGMANERWVRMSPIIHKCHINLQGRYSFSVPEAVSRDELRPLRNPDDPDA